MSTENFYMIVKCIRETEEGIALITDRSQPVTLASSRARIWLLATSASASATSRCSLGTAVQNLR